MRLLALLLTLTWVLSACTVAGGSPTTRFYSLEPAGSEGTMTVGVNSLAIGLGPVTLPDLLDRPQIITHNGAHEVELAEFHRWAGDLKGDITRHLALRLREELGTDNISLYPWPRQRKLDYEVRVDILRFSGALGSTVRLIGHWSLLDASGKEERLFKGFDLRGEAEGTDYTAQVKALSGLIRSLAGNIAEAIRTQKP